MYYTMHMALSNAILITQSIHFSNSTAITIMMYSLMLETEFYADHSFIFLLNSNSDNKTTYFIGRFEAS